MPTPEDIDEIDLFGTKMPNKSATVKKHKIIYSDYQAKTPQLSHSKTSQPECLSIVGVKLDQKAENGPKDSKTVLGGSLRHI